MTNNIDIVFDTENTNMIAETIINEIYTCINTISPAKLIQCTKNTVNGILLNSPNLHNTKTKFIKQQKQATLKLIGGYSET